MGKKTPLSPALGGGSRRDDSGGQLLRELEALSQVLYNAGQQQNGRPPRKETPSSPALASLRSQEALLSPQLAGRGPPSPHLGSRDSPSEEPRLHRRVRDGRESRSPHRRSDGPPSPYLGSQPEPRSPVIVSLNGTRGGKPPRVEPVSLYELPQSPQLDARRSADTVSLAYIEGSQGPLPRSPHGNGVASRSLRSRRSDEGSPYMDTQLGKIDENGSRRNEPQASVSYLRQAASDSITSKSPGSHDVTEITLSSAAAALQRPSVAKASRSFSPLSQSVDSGKRVEPYSLGGGREELRPWHSQAFERSAPEVANDNVQLEAPKEKRSLWNWKPFRAIAHIGAQRFNCMFTVHVHGIEGLPAVTNGLRLAVSWKRKEVQAQSMPARVFQGSAEFEESLYLKSVVYGTKDGSKGLKYEPKCFDLAVIALDVDELVLGKHRLDLSRLVPKDGRDEENDRSWTTRFKLAGKAKGGTLIVTFACQLLSKNGDAAGNLSSSRFSDSPMVKPLRSYSSLPSSPEGTSRSGWQPAHPSNTFFSPAMPEMPIDGEYMRMEHLSLNDEFHPGDLKKSSQKEQSRPSFSDSMISPVELTYNQRAAYSERQDMRKALSFDDDDGSEFTVVCQGHESSAISDSPSPVLDHNDPKADEDTVQGLPDDGDPEDSLQDSVAPGAQVGVDAPEVVSFLSDEQVSTEEQVLSEELVSREEQVSTEEQVSGEMQAEEPGAGTLQSQVSELVLADYEAGVVSEDSPVDAERISETGELSEGAIEKEDLVDVQDDWNVSVVEDLDVLTRSWSVGVPASNHVEEDETCREDFVEKDDEHVVMPVETEADEETATHVEESDKKDEEPTNLIEKDDEEDEKITDTVTKEEEIVEDEEIVEEEEIVEDEEIVEEEEIVEVEEIVEEEEIVEGEEIVEEENVEEVRTPSPQAKRKEEALEEEEDEYDLVCGEFLSLLRDPSPPAELSESGEDSPRAQLLKEFEREARIEGGLEFNFHLPEYAKFRVEGAQDNNTSGGNTPVFNQPAEAPLVPSTVTDEFDDSDWDAEGDSELAAIIEAAEAELEKATQILQSKARAKQLEDEETQALMQEWGLNDRAFEAEEEQESDLSMAIVPVAAPAPPLGNGLGSVLRFHDGGSVHSMNPAHFQNGGEGGEGGPLLMQASSPVVVPAEMGATSVDILRRMAVAGMEGMAAQAVMAMPLEDLTGKPLDQIPVAQRPSPPGFTQPLGSCRHGSAALGHDENNNALALLESGRTASAVTSYRFNKWKGSGPGVAAAAHSTEDQLVALEDLAPMAMLKIEALAVEGLKIQAEMAEQDAPYAVEPLADDDESSRRIVGVASGVSRRRNPHHGDFMSMDEWMRLDAGHEDNNDDTGERQTTTVATTTTSAAWKQQKQPLARRCFMDDTVTLAMLVHLRDPLRNNEPLGAPMMALVQAERVTKLPRRTSSHSRRSSSGETKSDEDSSPPAQFKIVDITIAGLRTSTDASSSSSSSTSASASAPIWGTQKQMAAGSRWLAAHGMAKSSSSSSSSFRAHSFKSKPGPPKPVLWSMSDRVFGPGARWRGAAAAAPLHPHIRNPDVLFADTGIRTC